MDATATPGHGLDGQYCFRVVSADRRYRHDVDLFRECALLAWPPMPSAPPEILLAFEALLEGRHAVFRPGRLYIIKVHEVPDGESLGAACAAARTVQDEPAAEVAETAEAGSAATGADSGAAP